MLAGHVPLIDEDDDDEWRIALLKYIEKSVQVTWLKVILY